MGKRRIKLHKSTGGLCPYLVRRPSVTYTNGIEEMLFKTAFEVESYLNGCSNPEKCQVYKLIPLNKTVRYELRKVDKS
jgi:hypothetical protein